jgi:hypothetical protein
VREKAMQAGDHFGFDFRREWGTVLGIEAVEFARQCVSLPEHRLQIRRCKASRRTDQPIVLNADEIQPTPEIVAFAVLPNDTQRDHVDIERAQIVGNVPGGSRVSAYAGDLVGFETSFKRGLAEAWVNIKIFVEEEIPDDEHG